MERVGRLSKNTAALVSARVVTSGLTFILAIIINRNLGPKMAGIYTYAFTLYTIFQVIPDFGLGNISIRDVSQETSRLQRYFRNIVSLRLLLGLLAFGLLMLTNFVTLALQGSGAVAGDKFWVVFTIAFCLLIEQPFSNSLCENFIALERLGIVAFVYLIMGIIKVAMSIYVVLAGFENVLVYLVLIYIITILYSIFHLYLAYRRAIRRGEHAAADASDMAMAEAVTHVPVLSGEMAMEALLADYSHTGMAEEAVITPDEDEDDEERAGSLPVPPPSQPGFITRFGPFVMDSRLWRYLLGSAWPLAVVAAGVTIYAGMDIPILSWIKGDEQVGLYSAAGMFAKALIFLTLAINMAVLPAISKVGGKYPRRLGEVWERLIHYGWLLIIPITVIIPVLARPILVLQKFQFIDAWHVTWLTMAAISFTFMSAISFPFFIVIDKQKTITAVVLFGLPIKAVLGILTIYLWGYTGAAISVLVSEAAVFGLLYWRLSRELDHRINPIRFTAVPLLMLGTLYPAAFVLHNALAVGKDTFMSSLQYAFIIAAALTILYLVIAFLTKVLSRKGLQELNDLLTV
ncbi:MAG: oligosaccharide flippase family protein [Actinobacteria bacterium]|nr:oligosaccharide flippase family protein [Actinomycetota bacterium]